MDEFNAACDTLHRRYLVSRRLEALIQGDLRDRWLAASRKHRDTLITWMLEANILEINKWLRTGGARGLDDLTSKELRIIATRCGISGVTKECKRDLILLIRRSHERDFKRW